MSDSDAPALAPPSGLQGSSSVSAEGHRLEPDNWDDFGQDMHVLLDTCVQRMKRARESPWQPKPADFAKRMKLTPRDIAAGQSAATVFGRLTEEIMPYATGNTHSRFWGWVHGTGLPVAVGAELVAATMNSNCGGRDHASVEVERAVIEWLVGLCELQGCLPRAHALDYSFGVLVSGTSQATILALNCARTRLYGVDFRKSGIAHRPPARVYAVQGAHSCVGRALEVLGHGSAALHGVPASHGQLSLPALQRAVQEDREKGYEALAVVATAGTVNLGEFDDFVAISRFCAKESIWLHIDAAFGFWLLLSQNNSYSELVRGIGGACSIALDFHKWMGIPYDCGAFLCYSESIHKSAFSSRPAYLQSAPSASDAAASTSAAAAASPRSSAGLAGGDLWMCDYTLELSRGFKALKVWASLQAVGTDTFGQVITDNCLQAAYMGELVEKSELLVLVRPVTSNICCFGLATADKSEKKDCDGDVAKITLTPSAIATRLQVSGDAVFSTTIIDGEECLRAAIVNQRTTRRDIDDAVQAVETCVNAP